MKLQTIDLIIIFGYLVLTVLVGFLISKKASKNLQSYFLGGNQMRWYILGISNASGMFDITGTMWTVSICFVYGLKSAWIPWLWPVWNQIFLMIFLAVWLRRSNVMTGAEWIRTRFGTRGGATMSHNIVVIFAIVAVIGFIAYGFQGIGKFSTSFLPWDLETQVGGLTISSANMYAIIIMGITGLYVIKGGMYSVVLTEVIQFLVMTVACVAVGIIAMNLVTPEQIEAMVPEGWTDLFFGWKMDLDWSNLIPAVNEKIKSDGMELFSIAIMIMIFKGILVSIAGPIPSYDMQRILATRTPKEAAKMSGFVSLVMYFPRYMLIAGLTVIALVFFSDEIHGMSGESIDFEMILPWTVSNFIPAGVMGLLLAGLIAAFMSTFAASVNAAPAYLVNDIYKRYINPNASSKTNIRMSYLASFLVIVVGIGFGFFVESIDEITKWIVAGLWGGYTAANLLKWIWWRFNGFGYFWGMIVGLIASLVTPVLLPEWHILNRFPVILAVSMIGCLIGTYAKPPTDIEVLKDFYKKVRPWGFWKPIDKLVKEENPKFRENTHFWRDMFNCAIGIVWQMTLVVMPIYMILSKWTEMIIAGAIFVVMSIILKLNWLNKIEN